ncbi:hypothetical protein GCM10007940_19160 [Portibacter lacus]|uniref:T9SS C-terminal target domain-containing protein n=2 Tax=Portibacter lacus TaxID=1099794 RepID=A0AA37SR67_9BACT|nr:hypothetical protein GCM10007940_19160 [Portibacter lacus]
MLLGQIAVDGIYDDWKLTDLLITDEGDNNSLDIQNIYVSNDDDHIYIRIDADREYDIQDAEAISIYIDADNDPNTGFRTNGIGSEISYYFENRSAYVNYANSFVQTNHAPLGMTALPTVTSSTFELVFNRKVTTSEGTIEMGNTIAISIENGQNGDQVPNSSGGVEYTMKDNETFTSTYALNKKDDTQTRVVTYNVLRDGFLNSEQKPHLEAILKALNPDVLALQEVYDTPLTTIRDLLNNALPLAGGKSWQYAKTGPDVMVFTKGTIEAYDAIDGNGVFLLYDQAGENPLILYNVHLPCCDNDSGRQYEIDNILSVLRDKNASPKINFTYPENAPIIITGDFNMVGKSQNIKSIIEGDIINEDILGADFAPDWDGTNLEEANPYITGFPSNYTWKSDFSSYNPGKLDFIFYTGSVMTQENGYVLATEYLDAAALNSLGLTSQSTYLASDHLPVVFDFSLGKTDEDMDGFASDVDCDDTNAAINPDADEIANNDIDENCDGEILIIDEDMDGFNSDVDCDDTNAAINPDADEIANNDIDENCDGEVLVIDEDMDGFNSDVDCDDTNAAINPDADEIVNNDIDENCDGEVSIIDEDMDGFNSDEDCDDTNAAINPGAVEIPNNEVDENCDGVLIAVDNDMDGFNSDVDCNDADATINPDATEIANNDVDENCDGILLVIDEDMDGFNSDVDCDDTNAAINPDAEDIPNNGIDEDCDGEDLISSTNDLFASKFEILPNPVVDKLLVNTDSDTKSMVTIYRIDGVKMLSTNVYNGRNSIDVGPFKTGIYLLRISNEKGDALTKTFVKL